MNINKDYSAKNIKYWFQYRILNENGTGAWFPAANFNGLFYHDFETDDVIFLGAFPDMRYDNEFFWKGLRFGNKLYFPPRHAKKMVSYDILTGVFQSEDIIPTESFKGIDFKLNYLGYISVVYKKEAFFIYRCSPMAVSVDMDAGVCDYITCRETGETVRIICDYCINGEYLIAPLSDSNRILVLNMEKHEMELKTIGDAGNRFFSVTTDDDKNLFVLRGNVPAIFNWNIENDEIVEFLKLPDIICSNDQPQFFFYIQSKFYVVPCYDWFGNCIDYHEVDVVAKKIKKIEIFKKYDSMIKFMVYKEGNKIGYFMMPYGEDIYCSENVIFAELNIVDESITERKIICPQNISEAEMYEKITEYQYHIRVRQLYENNGADGIQYETEKFSLDNFCTYISDLVIE